jgi:hypothetical protein
VNALSSAAGIERGGEGGGMRIRLRSTVTTTSWRRPTFLRRVIRRRGKAIALSQMESDATAFWRAEAAAE